MLRVETIQEMEFLGHKWQIFVHEAGPYPGFGVSQHIFRHRLVEQHPIVRAMLSVEHYCAHGLT